jgi:hydrogenase maturation protease
MILIAGVGNIFLGDDAFGSEVARRSLHLASKNVRVVDFGIRGLDLAYALTDGYDAVILIDAVSTGGEPGTIYVIEPSANDGGEVSAVVEGHSMDPANVLALARSMGTAPEHIRLVGCEPESFGSPDEGRMGLSPRVAAAVDEAIRVIEGLVREHEETKSRKAAGGAA